MIYPMMQNLSCMYVIIIYIYKMYVNIHNHIMALCYQTMANKWYCILTDVSLNDTQLTLLWKKPWSSYTKKLQNFRNFLPFPIYI